MNIKHVEINYNQNTPFSAQICHIDKLAPHYHETSLEIVFCLKGSVNYVSGFHKGTICEGQVFSIDCEDIHYLYSDVPNTVLVLHLDLLNMNRPWDELQCIYFACNNTHYFPYQQPALTKVKDIVLALSFEYFTGCPHLEEDRLTANELLEILLRYFNFYNYHNPDDYMNEDLHDRFYSITRYCYDNYDKKITISQLAEHAHIHPNYLSQYIGKSSFISFTTMLKIVRCYKAERLLLTTDMPNSEIAYACGFSDPKYLYSAFSHWWECSPHAHRKNYRTYMNSEESYRILDTGAAADALSSYIIKWHIEKTVSDK